MIPFIIYDAFFILLKSGLLLVTVSFVLSIIVKISNSSLIMYSMSMSYIKFYGLLHCLPLRKFECSTHSQAKVSKVHFRDHILFCFFNPVIVINITGLFVFYNIFRLKNYFEKVLPTIFVRISFSG